MHRRRSYGVALHFALPGVMSLLALVDPQDSAFWRVSFAIVALGGAFRGGLAVLRTEAILLTILVFLGFNVAWLLLFDDLSPAHGRPPAAAS